MNREIKFRGLTSGSSQWVIGDLIKLDTEILIASKDMSAGKFKNGHIELEAISVYPPSIGQFTGLHDKDGKEIYEGDRLKYSNTMGESGEGVIEFSAGFVIVWDLKTVITKTPSMMQPLFYFQCSAEWEVIGNIHEHPHLIGKEQSNG